MGNDSLRLPNYEQGERCSALKKQLNVLGITKIVELVVIPSEISTYYYNIYSLHLQNR